MSVTRLHPGDIGKPEVSDHDRVMAALNHAVEEQKADEVLGQSARGIAIVWLREYEDGTFGESWIIQGMNAIEAIGLMQMTAQDISDQGLDGRNPQEGEDE